MSSCAPTTSGNRRCSGEAATAATRQTTSATTTTLPMPRASLASMVSEDRLVADSSAYMPKAAALESATARTAAAAAGVLASRGPSRVTRTPAAKGAMTPISDGAVSWSSPHQFATDTVCTRARSPAGTETSTTTIHAPMTAMARWTDPR